MYNHSDSYDRRYQYNDERQYEPNHRRRRQYNDNTEQNQCSPGLITRATRTEAQALLYESVDDFIKDNLLGSNPNTRCESYRILNNGTKIGVTIVNLQYMSAGQVDADLKSYYNSTNNQQPYEELMTIDSTIFSSVDTKNTYELILNVDEYMKGLNELIELQINSENEVNERQRQRQQEYNNKPIDNGGGGDRNKSNVRSSQEKQVNKLKKDVKEEKVVVENNANETNIKNQKYKMNKFMIILVLIGLLTLLFWFDSFNFLKSPNNNTNQEL